MMTKEQHEFIKSLRERRRQLKEHLDALDKRERALRLALEEGRIEDEGLRELAWERVHALEAERWEVEDKLFEVEEMLEHERRCKVNEEGSSSDGLS
jgi:lipoate-protein ligase A